MVQLQLTAIPDIPLIHPGDDLAAILGDGMLAAGLLPTAGDVLVVASKVVSKAEGRLVRLEEVSPTPQAMALAEQAQKDPRLVELILQESNTILRVRPGLIIAEHRRGFVCANAGIDHSNVEPENEIVILLPENPDTSAQQLRRTLHRRFGVDLAVIINDSHGRAWRMGSVGVAIGVAGMHPLRDCRGERDLFGQVLRVTQVGTADEIAAAASALMGQGAEGRPAVLVRGVIYTAGEGSIWELLRPRELDMFR